MQPPLRRLGDAVERGLNVLKGVGGDYLDRVAIKAGRCGSTLSRVVEQDKGFGRTGQSHRAVLTGFWTGERATALYAPLRFQPPGHRSSA
jgi:hypothetical protein